MNMDKLVNWRREFRQIAEPGWMEIQTTIRIIEHLKGMGYTDLKYGREIHSDDRMGVPSRGEYEEYLKTFELPQVDFDTRDIVDGYTGVVAYLDTGRDGKTIGIRVDIDALGLRETDEPEHIPNALGFRSKNDFACHACGHDGHIAIGLGIAQYIMEHRDQLSGKYVILFQPAEEGVRGAKSMVDSGVLDELDYLMGSHIGMGEEIGTLGVGSEGFLGTAKYDIHFHGVPSHAGASPEMGKNALLAAASCALNLHSLPQYGTGMSRINVGVLSAGSGRNVVPSEATLLMELRGDVEEIVESLQERVDNVVRGTATTFEVDYDMEMTGAAAPFNTIHPEFVDFMGDELSSLNYKVLMRPKLGGSEDISYMMKRVEDNGGRVIHYLLGTSLKAPHHNDAFDYDEDVLGFGVQTFIDTIKIFSEI